MTSLVFFVFVPFSAFPSPLSPGSSLFLSRRKDPIKSDESLKRDARYIPRGGLRISSDGDDRRIFLGLESSIPGFFGVGKFGKYFFGWLVLSRDFSGYSKQSEDLW